MYSAGLGAERDDTEAVKWFRKAADQGNDCGQFGLGMMYEAGRGGLPVDVSQAVQWYTLASQQGKEQATESLRRLGKQ